MNNTENTKNTENLAATADVKVAKKPKKKALIIAIAAVLAVTIIASTLIVLSGCGDKDKPPIAETANIIENGVANYAIVYPDACSGVLDTQLISLVSAIQAKTGVRLDMIKASLATDPDANYILIGATGFAESEAAVASLKGNEDAYTIEKAGKHIVFAGHFDSSTASAIEYFVLNMLNSGYDATTNTLTLKEYWFDGTLAFPASFDAKNLSLYTIVYSSKTTNAKATAEKIQQRIKETTGKTLEVKRDTGVSESAYEIIIGETNRALSQKCYDKTYLMEYEFVVEKGQLQIVCGGLYSARMAGYELANLLVDKDFSFATGAHGRTNLAPKNVAHTAGTDARIMTANILSYGQITSQAMNFPNSDERAEIFAKILVDYTPDFVGVQEMDSTYHKHFNNFLKVIKETYGIEYSIILAKANGATNHSPIIYRSDKYKCDDQKFTPVSYAKNPTKQKETGELEYGSGISSAKFTSLTDPTKEIAILSSHWHWEKEIASGTDNQYYDAKEMEAVINEIAAKYPNAKIFSTGDFNSHRYSGKYLRIFLENTDGEIASTIAKKNGVLKPSFQHMNQYIDHIIGKKGTFDVLLHQGTDNCSKTLTDHQPVFADIKFTK